LVQNSKREINKHQKDFIKSIKAHSTLIANTISPLTLATQTAMIELIKELVAI
jgi:hypothetical protein